MADLQWNSTLELGVERMDATHREFVELWNRLAEADADELMTALDALVAHTIDHFGQENRWMERVGFPGCHRAEHDRVLEVLAEVQKHAARGDVFFVRRLVEELPRWFENHAGGMDAALAFHLQTIGFDFETETVPSSEGPLPQGGCGCAAAAALDEQPLPEGR